VKGKFDTATDISDRDDEGAGLRPLVSEITGSNSARGMDVCLLCVLYAGRYRSLQRTDLSSRAVLPNVFVCVIERDQGKL